MDDFISSFEGDKPRLASGMAFVKGGIEGKAQNSSNSDRGSLYQPKPRYKSRETKRESPPRNRSPPRRKRRAIDELKEEFSK